MSFSFLIDVHLLKKILKVSIWELILFPLHPSIPHNISTLSNIFNSHTAILPKLRQRHSWPFQTVVENYINSFVKE